jgi:hypothetical protein
MRKGCAVAAAIVTVLASRAAADPILHFKSPSTVTTQKGSVLTLPPGYFLDEPTWKDKDAEMRRLQDAETRYKAENDSLRKSAAKQWFDWKVVVAAAAAGFAAGGVIALVK